MKKLIATILLLTLALFSFASCSDEEVPTDKTQIRVGYLTGPTGVGMAKLINDNKDDATKYSFKSHYSDTQAAMADLLTNKVDVACLPTNVVPSYFKSQNDNIVVLSINTLNTLFFVTKDDMQIESLEDLDGQTIYTCEAGTPKIILTALLQKAGVNATVSTQVSADKKITNPEALRNEIISGSVSIAFAPEPIVSASSAARQGAGKTPYTVALSCDDAWKAAFGADSEIPMGCIVANKEFATAHPFAIKAFMNEYKASIEYMSDPKNLDSAANYVVDAGILPNAKVAKSALTNLGASIAYIDGEDMKDALEGFYKTMGIALPESKLYYEK